MGRKNYMFYILLPVLAFLFTGCEPDLKNPNIILMMADDLGWGDTGYNGNEIIQTPHLDQMSEEGIRFNRFYSGSAVCSPTRASVLTGRNPFRMGVFTANKGILRPEEITIAEALKTHGYVTGHFGKWHLGTLTYEESESNRGRPGNLKDYNPPALHGFDVAFSTEAKVPTWDPMKRPVKGSGGGGGSGWASIDPDAPYELYGTPYRDIHGNKVSENLDGDDSRVIMDRVLPFIEDAKESGSPFFAVVWFHTPHKPCVAGPEYRELYKDYDIKTQNYAGCITAMDDQIGRLRAFLTENKLDENTMLCFCSDNGPENGNPGSTGGHRERKRSLHDGGIRVPGLMVWPAGTEKPFTTEIPCVTSDYLPTILDIVGEDMSQWPHELDGSSLLPLIEDGELDRREPIGFAFGDQSAWVDEQYKLYSRSGEFALYDMQDDPTESEDLKASFSEMADQMTKGVTDWLDRCQGSFQGKEYGTESVERMEQRWQNPLLKEKNKEDE